MKGWQTRRMKKGRRNRAEQAAYELFSGLLMNFSSNAQQRIIERLASGRPFTHGSEVAVE
jgi:hypothetical protein